MAVLLPPRVRGIKRVNTCKAFKKFLTCDECFMSVWMGSLLLSLFLSTGCCEIPSIDTASPAVGFPVCDWHCLQVRKLKPVRLKTTKNCAVLSECPWRSLQVTSTVSDGGSGCNPGLFALILWSLDSPSVWHWILQLSSVLPVLSESTTVHHICQTNFAPRNPLKLGSVLITWLFSLSTTFGPQLLFTKE